MRPTRFLDHVNGLVHVEKDSVGTAWTWCGLNFMILTHLTRTWRHATCLWCAARVDRPGLGDHRGRQTLSPSHCSGVANTGR